MSTDEDDCRPKPIILLSSYMPNHRGFNQSIDMAGWSGLDSPNGTNNFPNMKETCGRTPETGCLYNVWEGAYDL